MFVNFRVEYKAQSISAIGSFFWFELSLAGKGPR